MKWVPRILLCVLVLCVLRAPKLAAQDVDENGSRPFVAKVAPIYPALARKMGLEGDGQAPGTCFSSGCLRKTCRWLAAIRRLRSQPRRRSASSVGRPQPRNRKSRSGSDSIGPHN